MTLAYRARRRFLANALTHLVKLRGRLLANVLQLDDVPAELGLHGLLGELADLKRERRVGELLDHATLGEIAEITAVGTRRAGRLLLGHLGEVGTVLEILDDRLGLFLRFPRGCDVRDAPPRRHSRRIPCHRRPERRRR